MITKILGTGDIIAAITTAALALTPIVLPKTIIFYIAGYLILKGGMFALTGNIVSYIDVFCGLYLILLSFGVSFTIITLFVVIFLIQKNLLVFVS